MKGYKKNKCCVRGCTNHESKRHRFPREPALLKKWIEKINESFLWDLQPDQIYQTYYVCDRHFAQEYLVPGTRRGLRKDAIPTLCLSAILKEMDRDDVPAVDPPQETAPDENVIDKAGTQIEGSRLSGVTTTQERSASGVATNSAVNAKVNVSDPSARSSTAETVHDICPSRIPVKTRKRKRDFASSGCDVICPWTGFTQRKEITASRRTISIVPFNPPIEGFLLPLQVMENIDERSVKIKLSDFSYLIFSFDTPAEKIEFTNALGDLNIE